MSQLFPGTAEEPGELEHVSRERELQRTVHEQQLLIQQLQQQAVERFVQLQGCFLCVSCP